MSHIDTMNRIPGKDLKNHRALGKSPIRINRRDLNIPAFPREVVEDLATFGLKPPSSLEEVRSARNREIKKYHPDKFMNDRAKLEHAKEIMQIYNAAYDRLKAYYKNQ